MNIVFTGEFTYPDGMAATKRIQNFIDYLTPKVSVKVFLFDQSSAKQPKFVENAYRGNVPYTIVGSNISFSLSLLYKVPLSYILSCWYLLKFKIRKERNVLYVYNGLTIENIVFVLFAKIIGYKIVVEYVEDLRLPSGAIRRGIHIKNQTNVFFERFIPILVNGIVVISSYLFSKFEKYNKKVSLIHIPITAKIPEEDESEIHEESIFTIAYSGSFGSKDGLETLIEAFKKFAVLHPQSKLLLAGINKNKELINKHLTDNKIKYIGYLPDEDFYPFLMKASTLCITRNKMKFANAGFPFKLGEYLATGKPVITSNVSDMELYIDNYIDAIVVEPESVDQIVDALMFLIKNKDEAKEIGRRGRLKCKRFFDPEINTTMLLGFLAGLK